MANDVKNALTEFVRFAQMLRGDETSEAQTFLDHFFRALGHDGVIEAGNIPYPQNSFHRIAAILTFWNVASS